MYIGLNLHQNKVSFGKIKLINSLVFYVIVIQDVPFNVSYSIVLSPEFFDWAIYKLPKSLYTFVFFIFLLIKTDLLGLDYQIER